MLSVSLAVESFLGVVAALIHACHVGAEQGRGSGSLGTFRKQELASIPMSGGLCTAEDEVLRHLVFFLRAVAF